MLSIVAPVYRSAEIVAELVSRIDKTASSITNSYEIILVEDGSPDESWQAILAACSQFPNLRGIRLSRNFGQHPAIFAGLSLAKGQWVVIMDADLQDEPAHIKRLYERAISNPKVDIVYSYHKDHQHSWWRSFTSNLYNRLLRVILRRKAFDKHVRNYSIISRKVVDAYLRFEDAEPQYLMLLSWLGFQHDFIEVPVQARFSGKSTYTLSRLIDLAVSGLTFRSSRILHIPFWLGLLFLFVGLVPLLLAVSQQSISIGNGLLLAIIFFSSGMVMMSLGFIGLYLGKVFRQARKRPLFIIDEEVSQSQLHTSIPSSQKQFSA